MVVTNKVMCVFMDQRSKINHYTVLLLWECVFVTRLFSLVQCFPFSSFPRCNILNK